MDFKIDGKSLCVDLTESPKEQIYFVIQTALAAAKHCEKTKQVEKKKCPPKLINVK